VQIGILHVCATGNRTSETIIQMENRAFERIIQTENRASERIIQTENRVIQSNLYK
jgi:hypothetical protein